MSVLVDHYPINFTSLLITFPLCIGFQPQKAYQVACGNDKSERYIKTTLFLFIYHLHTFTYDIFYRINSFSFLLLLYIFAMFFMLSWTNIT